MYKPVQNIVLLRKKFVPSSCRYYKLLLVTILFFSVFHNGFSQRVRPIKVNALNANLYRDSLAKNIFGAAGMPYGLQPDEIATNVQSIEHQSSFTYSGLFFPAGNLDSIDRISTRPIANLVDFPDMVNAYLFHPHNSNGKLFIYHSGHCAGASTTEDIFLNSDGNEPGYIIPTLIKEGYTVLAVPMINYKSPYPLDYVCGFNGHNEIFSDNHYQNPLAAFFNPLVASLNYVGRSNYSAIYMCGLSGGGWTTSVYPALDSSISYSFPVAGSWPLPVAIKLVTGGDAEQNYLPLFRQLLDYHDLYTLSCLAPARKMLQINNRYDACCFSGSIAHLYYVDTVVNALRGTGGEFRFYIDEIYNQHRISENALKVILTFIANETATLSTLPSDSVLNGAQYSYNIGSNFSVNTTPDNFPLKYSLLKAPSWISLNNSSGVLSGRAPTNGIIAKPDTISFKVEDSTGRFVVHSYILKKEREVPYFFTNQNDSIVYFLPAFSNSIQTVNPTIISAFFLNNPLLSVTGIRVINNSFLELKLNGPVSITDSIGYNGSRLASAITFNNGIKQPDFDLTNINLNAIISKYALAGMIRFNTDTKKFEYFNGVAWINLN